MWDDIEPSGAALAQATPDAPAVPLHELVRARAQADPDALAVVFEDQRLTYGQLSRRADALARRLRAAGVGPDTVVGLALERSPELVVGALGILRAGGAFLPLDPAYPADRLAYMVQDAGVRLLVTRDEIAARLPDTGAARITPDAGEADDDADDAPPVHPDQLAYVIYTSGSTGRPKGVMLTHRGLANLAEAEAGIFGAGPEKRVLQFAPASFDASVFELAMALRTGATLVLSRRDGLIPGPGLLALLRGQSITHATLPPSVLAALPAAELPRLETLVCAGEALPEALVDRWAPGRRMYNAYGPTEATVWATVAPMDARRAGKPTIGRPIRGARVVVLDDALNPAAPGQAGELAIGGAGVARGYRGRPALTAERFIPDAWSGQPGARLYRTGDLARQLPGGELEFLGRRDHQVKLRGHRIEPGEIAAVLARHPEVRDAVVVLRADGGDERLVAYAAADDADPAALREHLAAHLPEYMVPAAVVVLPSLPLTPSGKVDRDALPAPDRAAAGLAADGTAPRTEAERALAQIVSELLGIDGVGVEDDIFALGAHSLIVGQLVTRIRGALGVDLPLSAIYEAPTVAGLAARLRAPADELPPLPPVRPAPRDRPIPLSFPQERVWFLGEMAPGNLAYNAQATLRFRGPLDAAVLEKALNEIVRRHEIFRTAFHKVDGQAVQEPRPPIAIHLPVHDLTSFAGDGDARAEEIVREALREPFDLANPPLVRWLLIRHAADDHTFVQVEHHFVHDGWSFALLMGEIQALYEAFADGKPSPLADPPIQYADFAFWQRERMQGPVLQKHLDWWTNRLAGAPPALELPTDHPRPGVQSFRGAAVRMDLDPALSRRLRAYSRAHGVTLFTTMFAGFATLMQRYSGQTDLLVGTAAANRRLPEIERMIGMVVNTLIVRLDLAGRPAFGELVRRAHRAALEAYAWQDVPLDRLVNALAPARDPSRNPLFQVMFSFHDSPVPDMEFRGLTGTVLERHNGSAKSDLNIVVIPRGEQRVGRAARPEDDRITLIWEYSTDLWEHATAQRMVEHYCALLDAALADDATPIPYLPLLGPDEARTVVEEWNRTEADFDRTRTVPALVADRAREAPDALALRWEGGSLSYGRMDAHARAVARRLIDAGVGREDRVAVCAPRGAELVVAELGALYAGAAFLPIDPAYPPERIAFLLRDSRAAVLLAATSVHDRLPEIADGIQLLSIDLTDAVDGDADADLPVAVDPRGLAYVIYTSGSTGTPKGVGIEHAGLLNLVQWHRRAYGTSRGDRAAPVASPGFDASIWEVWPSLASGASLHFPADDVRGAPAELARWLTREGITVTFLPTPLAEAVLEERWPDDARLRLLLTGGDALGRAPRPGLPFTLVNHYGPTEGSVVATAVPVEPAQAAGRRPTIGRGIANVRVYVLDEALQPRPAGLPGELYVGGAGLARGYLDRPALTAERFVPDPFASRPGQRLYRTGDLVRWTAEGEIDFLGRADHQVKVRGFRVEPGEVEAALAAHPSVREAVVAARDDAPGGRGLVAYVVATSTAQAEDALREELRAFLRERLPGYMVPAAFVLLDTLPLGAHGKVDRTALPAPAPSEATFTEPRTGTERRVAAICAELLGRPAVGVDDDFYAIGGHSLLAARVVARVNQALGVDLPLRRFLLEPTVARLAAAADQARRLPSAEEAPAIRPVAWRDAGRLLEQLDRLSAAEVEALLNEMRDPEVQS